MGKDYRDAALNVKASSYEAAGTIEVETGTGHYFSGPVELQKEGSSLTGDQCRCWTSDLFARR